MRPGNRDDMVIRVRLPESGAMPSAQGGGTEDDAAAPAAARTPKKKKGGGFLKRLAKARILRKLLSKSAYASRLMSLGSASLRAATTPVGALGALGALATLTTARASTGLTLETMGWKLENYALGNAPQDASAATAARESLSPYLRRYVAQNGVTDGVRRIYEAELKFWKDEMRGRAMFMRSQDFQANGTLDLFLLTVAKAAARAWNDSAGPKWTATLVAYLAGDPLTPQDFKIDVGAIK